MILNPRPVRVALTVTVTLVALACCPRPVRRPVEVAKPTAVKPAQPAPEPARSWPAGMPETRRQAIVETIHGQQVSDPYRWLELMSDETRAWLAAQDNYGRTKLNQLAGRDLLRARIKELSYVEWTSAPQRRGRRYFFARRHQDKEKTVYYFRQGRQGKDQVLIDPNAMSEDGSVSVRGVKASYDGRRVAYKISRNNADEATLQLMDVATRKVSKVDVIEGAKYATPSWTPKGDGFYYTRLPVDKSIKVSERPGHAAVYFHKLGQDPRQDRLIHPNTGDPRTFIHADLSRDGRFLFLYVFHGWTRTDVYYKDLRRGKQKGFKPFAVGLKAKFGLFAYRGKIYVHTNLDAPRWRLYAVDPRKVERKDWQEIVAEDPEAVLEDVAVRGKHLALSYLRRASTVLKIARLDGKPVREIELPGIGTASGLVGNPKDDEAYYTFQSFTRPRTVYRTSVRRGGSTLYFETKVPVDPKPFVVEQVSYPSKDGTKISMFIIRRKDAPKDGSAALMLYGYGGFNISLTPVFRGDYFAWLEQGASLAIPNLRGGGEYGEAWHQAGMRSRKQNVFDDFIAAAEYLIGQGYTRADRLAIRGGSNGGLLVGAAMTQRPELFRAVACHVPLLDMVRYHLFGSGKTWISEYGSADDPALFKALHAYSPYHRIMDAAAYPALLMLTADSDDRVDPMHARKFVAAIQHANRSEHPIWLRVETKSGHGGGDMIKKKVEARTDEYAFLLHELGITPKKAGR